MQRILQGHFLTRDEAARRAGISPEEVANRPDLLHVGGEFLEEVYFEFQFGPFGVIHDLGAVVETLRGVGFDDVEIADWMARPNLFLNGYGPIQWQRGGHKFERLMDAAKECGPVHDWGVETGDQHDGERRS